MDDVCFFLSDLIFVSAFQPAFLCFVSDVEGRGALYGIWYSNLNVFCVHAHQLELFYVRPGIEGNPDVTTLSSCSSVRILALGSPRRKHCQPATVTSNLMHARRNWWRTETQHLQKRFQSTHSPSTLR